MRPANPINLHSVDHVVLRAASLDTMLAFYCDVLGCRLERGPGELGLAQLRAGQSLIDLVSVDGKLGKLGGGPPDHARPNMDHFCLHVMPWDETAICAHLERHQVDFDPPAPRYSAYGHGPSIYLRDPEGNTVELSGAG